MPLSEYEQRVLDQMERALTSDDPRWATTMKSTQPRSGLRWIVAGVAVVAGLLILVLGVFLKQPIVGVLGFVAMFAGVLFAFTAPKSSSSGPEGVVDGDGSVQASPKSAVKTTKPGFFNRLEDRWDRRRGEGR